MLKINYTYCDANIFLAYFNAESGRVQVLDQLFEEVQKDSQRKIATSVISITEVSHLAEEKRRSKLDPKTDAAFESFWSDSSLIEFVDFNELVARQARDFIRAAINQGYALKTNDAIHLISAKFAGVTECFTYDIKLHKFTGMLGFDIKPPYVSAPQLPLSFDEDE